jgi:hypothetical protein
MALSKKQILYDGAFKIVDSGKEISISEFTFRILTEIGGISRAESAEYISKFERSILNNLKKQNDELQRRGISIVGNIIGNRISWISASPMQKVLWEIRPIYLKIIESLSDEKFEALCCVCINLIGGQAWRTKNKGDGNVDLYGIVKTKMDNHIFGESNKFRIVGQCKNYSHPESITNFEAFFRALENVKFQAPRVSKEIPNEFIRENGPIFGWYICKDGFQSGIHDEARRHGVVISDKYDLVEIMLKLELHGISSLKSRCHLNLTREIKKFIK